MSKYKQLPDGPGCWENDKGERCWVMKQNMHNAWRVVFVDRCAGWWPTLHEALDDMGIRPGRWQQPPQCEWEEEEWDDPDVKTLRFTADTIEACTALEMFLDRKSRSSCLRRIADELEQLKRDAARRGGNKDE